MKVFSLACFFCLAAPANAANREHPIEKVINMLEGLKAKAILDGKNEAVAYNKFKYWCSTSIDTVKGAIADEKEKISELEDSLSGLRKEEEILNKEIETLEGEIAEREAAGQEADKDRAKEEALYKKANGDAKDTIAAVAEALRIMNSAEGKTEALVQTHVNKVISLISLSSSVTEAQLDTLQKFADKQRPKQLAEGDLEAHVDKYDFKSENVVELLKQLMRKFEDDSLALTKAETNAVNAYNLAKQARDNAIKAAKASKGKKTTNLGKVEGEIKQAESDLEDTEADLKADSKTLEDTESSCATKKSEWEQRSETRTNEIAAMDMAMKILAKAGGVRTEAPGNPVPPPSPVFLQIKDDESPKMSAVLVLREAAKATHSKALERMAVEVKAHLNGPFDQVNNMIEKMVFRLMDEQKQEDEHKHWCDQELEKTNTMKDDKTDKIADLKAEIEVETATVSKLTEDILEAEEMIAKIIAFKKEATEVRETGKKENKLALADAETGQTAVSNAVAVLTEFYKSSGKIKKEDWEFVQEPAKLPENPKTWESGYTGLADPANAESGIISMLERVGEDFARMEADTKAQEAADQKEYDQAMSDHDIELARRKQEAQMKTDEKKRRNSKIADLTRQKKDTSTELEKTQQYLDDLQKACVDTDGDSTYEKRKAARSDEITALKKAQGILLDAFKEKDTKATKFLEISRHA